MTEFGDTTELTLEPSSIPEPILESSITEPYLINVGMPYGIGPKIWRRILTLDVLPRLAAFKPDLILISAGFDGHHKDTINCGYLGLREEDYEWVTNQLVKIANTTCQGRVVSVLEGGYRVQGRIVSAFGRSVAAHVRALAHPTGAKWDTVAELERLGTEMRAEAVAESEREASKTVPVLRAGLGLTILSSGAGARLASPLPTPSGATPRTISSTPAANGAGGITAAGSTASSVPPTPVPTVGTDLPMVAESSDLSSTGRRSKRGRVSGAIDYAALDAQMRAEEESHRATKLPKMEDGPASAGGAGGQ